MSRKGLTRPRLTSASLLQHQQREISAAKVDFASSGGTFAHELVAALKSIYFSHAT